MEYRSEPANPQREAPALLAALTDIEPRGLRELRAINRPTRATARRWYTGAAPPQSVAKAVGHAVQAAERGFDLYYTLNARAQATGRREGVLSVGALCADVDDERSWPRVHALERVGVAPSAVVASGRGWHVYYLLAAPIATSDGEQLNADLAAYLDSDRVWDATRCPRLPGTINWRWRRRVWLATLDLDRRYGVEELRAQLPLSPFRVRSHEQMALPALSPTPRSWPELGVPPRLCEFFRVYGQGDRSRIDAAVALALRERGADLITVAEALQGPTDSKLTQKLYFEGEEAAASYLRATVSWADSVLARRR